MNRFSYGYVAGHFTKRSRVRTARTSALRLKKAQMATARKRQLKMRLTGDMTELPADVVRFAAAASAFDAAATASRSAALAVLVSEGIVTASGALTKNYS